jgi:hypothetical protein
LGAIASFRKTGAIPQPMMPPLFVLPLVIAYQADFAYFNKADRIRSMFYSMLVSSLPLLDRTASQIWYTN